MSSICLVFARSAFVGPRPTAPKAISLEPALLQDALRKGGTWKISVDFSKCFEDPLTRNAARRDILETPMISLLTSPRGGQTRVDMADFAVLDESFLHRLMRLERGLPGRDAFSLLVRTMDSVPFATVRTKALEASGGSRSTARCSGPPSRAPRRSRRCISRIVFRRFSEPELWCLPPPNAPRVNVDEAAAVVAYASDLKPLGVIGGEADGNVRNEEIHRPTFHME